jgi:hypothetical protein
MLEEQGVEIVAQDSWSGVADYRGRPLDVSIVNSTSPTIQGEIGASGTAASRRQ